MGAATVNAKGQILSLEVIIAFSFFLAAMLIFLASWNSMFAAYYREAAMRQMETSLVGISDMLVMSPGEPADWEFSALENASSFGLAASRNSLSLQKLSALQSLNSSYDKVREGMGAGASQLYIAVKGENGGVIYSFGNPYDPIDPDIYSVSADRLALLDGQLVKVTVQVWRKK
ncbi:MAG: hypothetical protein M0P42_15735 [Gallionella sp.]|nr:hypothetical protein [Gallionella sp.]